MALRQGTCNYGYSQDLRMDRIVLDTNSLLRTYNKTSPWHEIWTAVLHGEIALCVTTEILLEYEEKIGKFVTPEFASKVCKQITSAPLTEFVNVKVRWNMIANDPDDNKFVDCAIASGAKCIVTNDKDYKIFRIGKNIWPMVNVKKLEEYYKDWKTTTLSGTSHRKTARPRPRKKK